MIAPVISARDSQTPAPPGSGAAPESDLEPDARARRRVLCAACSGFVTEREARIEVNGKHEHTFINPAGIIYKIGCFERAPGTIAAGAASDEWAWFPGFAWQALCCRSCFEHLGWSFSKAETVFVGLILERLVEG